MRYSVYSVQRYIPLALAVLIGIGLAFFAARQMLRYTETHKETVRVPVPAHDIASYMVIGSKDLIWREVVRGGEEIGAVKTPSKIVGKVALYPLYRGEQIREERLGDTKDLMERRIVSVNIDVGRCVGGSISPGDLVDVWWVDEVSTPGIDWVLAVPDAVVLDVRDSNGRSVVSAGGGVIQQAQQVVSGGAAVSGPPAIAVLAVKREDVPKMVGGAHPRSDQVILVKKFAPGGEVSQVEVASGGGEAAFEEESGEDWQS